MAKSVSSFAEPEDLPFPSTSDSIIEAAKRVHTEISDLCRQKREAEAQKRHVQATTQAKRCELINLIDTSELGSWVKKLEYFDLAMYADGWKTWTLEETYKSLEDVFGEDCQWQIAKQSEELRQEFVTAVEEAQNASDEEQFFREMLVLETRILMLKNLPENVERLLKELDDEYTKQEKCYSDHKTICVNIERFRAQQRTLSNYPAVESQALLLPPVAEDEGKEPCHEHPVDELHSKPFAAALKMAGVYYADPGVDCTAEPYNSKLPAAIRQADHMLVEAKTTSWNKEVEVPTMHGLPLRDFSRSESNLLSEYQGLRNFSLHESFSPEVHNVSETVLQAATEDLRKLSGMVYQRQYTQEYRSASEEFERRHDAIRDAKQRWLESRDVEGAAVIKRLVRLLQTTLDMLEPIRLAKINFDHKYEPIHIDEIFNLDRA